MMQSTTVEYNKKGPPQVRYLKPKGPISLVKTVSEWTDTCADLIFYVQNNGQCPVYLYVISGDQGNNFWVSESGTKIVFYGSLTIKTNLIYIFNVSLVIRFIVGHIIGLSIPVFIYYVKM